MTDKYINLAKLKSSLAPLAGAGFNLRLLGAEDLSTTLAWRNREDVRHHFIKSEIISLQQHLSWWEEYCTRDNDFVFVIEETEKLNRPVGQVSLYNIDLKKGEAEYGRLMIGDSKARGRGLARRATEFLLTWAFNSLEIKRIYLRVLKDNTIAINRYRRFGFISCVDNGRLHLMSIAKGSDPRMFEDIKQEDSVR